MNSTICRYGVPMGHEPIDPEWVDIATRHGINVVDIDEFVQKCRAERIPVPSNADIDGMVMLGRNTEFGVARIFATYIWQQFHSGKRAVDLPDSSPGIVPAEWEEE